VDAALVAIAVVIVVVVSLPFSFRRVQPWQRMVIYRLGRTGPEWVRGPGIHFLVPVWDRGVLVDTREQSARTPPQTLLTSDKEAVAAELEFTWRIVDPLLSQTNVANFGAALQGVGSTIAREIAGNITADELMRRRHGSQRRCGNAWTRSSPDGARGHAGANRGSEEAVIIGVGLPASQTSANGAVKVEVREWMQQRLR
jgi:regulator of protease activity HflC (stomatin/prohibitin superfamily)